MKLGKERLGDLAGRGALATALVLATTLSGMTTHKALASGGQRAARTAARVAADPIETVFAFGDDIESVNYEVGFEPTARNLDRLAAACREVFADEPTFESTALSVGKAKDIGRELVADAQPTVELCFDPMSSDENAEAKAAEGFADFHERAFDFADAVAH